MALWRALFYAVYVHFVLWFCQIEANSKENDNQEFSYFQRPMSPLSPKSNTPGMYRITSISTQRSHAISPQNESRELELEKICPISPCDSNSIMSNDDKFQNSEKQNADIMYCDETVTNTNEPMIIPGYNHMSQLSEMTMTLTPGNSQLSEQEMTMTQTGEMDMDMDVDMDIDRMDTNDLKNNEDDGKHAYAPKEPVGDEAYVTPGNDGQ